MGLSKEAIEEFKRIYSQEMGEEISDDKARELGESLANEELTWKKLKSALFRLTARASCNW